MGLDDNLNNEKPQPSKKRKHKEVAIFGNYKNYYGYRVGQDLEEDPRLTVLKNEWFESKDCLDIGCNNGTITVAIAKKFGCRSILGVDIDGDRVEEAYWNLRRIVKMSTPTIPPKTTKLEDAAGVNEAQHSVTELRSGETMESLRNFSSLQEKDLLNIVTFRKGNFVQNWRPPEDKSYHTIICLSVTKWIHLNWGDDGLILLFAKIWKLLQPGGIFILEPQPWDSYYKNRLVSEMAKTNYHNIKIFPEGFQEVLLDKIGFRKVENITSSLSGSKSGFNRPILAFWK
ncbi:probable RNA methyltransferase At5g51130 [Actinidia eriantha]|uniref:probable RNA methyltransferase At5g51130 n=1 Tax=Actinidia eriantha TaxID=165200 RepID=UPI0025868099|nr:probable RNA methyltransferase At5g51130 [Actinidia eriantha]